MGVLDAFLSTWSQARATFGEGAPAEGAQFDNSAALHGFQDSVAAAKPDAAWTGTAADRYADENSRHGSTLGAMAGLDKRLATEVDRSADVVAAGRRDLDAVRQWVVAAASSVPRTAAGEQMLLPVVSKGAGEIADIVARSNGDMSAIAARMRGLGDEYQALQQPIPASPAETTDPKAPDPQDVALWYNDWEDLQSRIARHNAVWPRPPINTPAGIAYQAEKEELDLEQAKLVLEAADLGIQVTVTETE